ncbi:hypothetical protein, partial [Rhodococcus jostii]|uniref:hypothetical protein n=1 Tax=Rhodococcus jostii TaxID=132919 RepID=UPI00365B2DC1
TPPGTASACRSSFHREGGSLTGQVSTRAGAVPNDWKSLSADFERTYADLGPELNALFKAEYSRASDALNDLLKLIDVRKTPSETIEKARDALAPHVEQLCNLQASDDAFVAAWSDLVNASKDRTQSAASLGFRRDTLWSIADRRELPCGRHNFARDLISIMEDYAYPVREAQARLNSGDSVDPSSLDLDATSGLTADERVDLCKQVLIAPPETAHCVVWLRFDNACLPEREVSYGQVTFYWATYLSAHVGFTPWWEHNANFSVVPIEMLKPLEYRYGPDEDEPDVVDSTTVTYARVDLGVVATNRAEQKARDLVNAIIEANHPIEDGWRPFHSSIVVKNGRRLSGWGDDYSRSAYMKVNDDMGTSLMTMSTLPHTISHTSSPILVHALGLRSDLNRAEKDDPIVKAMASVRAVEHGNSWSDGGKDQWYDFADGYLKQNYARIVTVGRLGHAAQQAIHGSPEPRPGYGQAEERELREIRSDVTRTVWPAREQTNCEKSISYLPKLAEIYKDHPLGRQLQELADTYSSGPALYQSLCDETSEFSILLQRLRRVRNCAVHGGPISTRACQSVGRFAFDLGHQTINSVIDAILDESEITDYMVALRDSTIDRFDDIRDRGDFARLFVDSPQPSRPSR